jgi:hypothetical protein
MAKFKIEHRGDDIFVTNLDHNFTLKVIPPEKQPDCYELGRQVVGADFVSLSDRIVHGSNEPCYDFESLDDGYYDDDTSHCNKQLWFETIEYFCQLVLDKEPTGYTAYNYQYELTEENCSPECWESLGKETADHMPELPFGATVNHQSVSKTIQLENKTIQIRPDFQTIEQAKADGVYTYKLFDFMMDLTYLPEWSRPQGYVSPDEMDDAENPHFFGRLLFDPEGYWAYDGNRLNFAEQEKLADAVIKA